MRIAHKMTNFAEKVYMIADCAQKSTGLVSATSQLLLAIIFSPRGFSLQPSLQCGWQSMRFYLY
jgi:hypothetical protein